jgi:hypothetical protein
MEHKITKINNSKTSKILKYIILGLIILFCLNYIPNTKLSNRELMLITIITVVALIVLEQISPIVKIKKI